MINPALDPETVAQQVGAQGVDNLVNHAERICAYEQQRIELANQGTIASILDEHHQLVDEERRLEELLRLAPPSNDSRRLRVRAIFCWTVTVVLAASGFALTMLTLTPFRLGPKTWIYSIGVSLLAPFLIEQVLEQWPVLIRILTPFAATAGVSGLMLFAVIRGDLLAQEIHQNESPAVIVDDAQPQQEFQNDFYGTAVPALWLAMLLLAFSIEVGSGIALREARRSAPNCSEDWSALRKELRIVRQRKAGIMRLAVDHRNEPAIFAARFRRDFYRAMLSNAARSAMTKFLVIGFALALLGAQTDLAEDRADLVVALDLSRSVAINGPDSKSEFQKNVEGVTGLLSQVTAGSRVTVIGITDHSFAQPYVILSAHIPTDPGYFGERLTAARTQLVSVWKRRAAKLNPHFPCTDILGALQLASQIFTQYPDARQKSLVVFSDMRQNTPELDLETPVVVPSFSAIVKRLGPFPPLLRVRAYVSGVGGAGKSSAYWQGLQDFWKGYFSNSGAVLKTYTVLRGSLQLT